MTHNHPQLYVTPFPDHFPPLASHKDTVVSIWRRRASGANKPRPPALVLPGRVPRHATTPDRWREWWWAEGWLRLEHV